MQKTAQQRGILNRVREKVSPTGKLEEFFDPEFKSIMEKLRKVDDQIRAELTGKQIGDEFPTGPDGKPAADVDDVPNFKEYIKDAEKHLDKKEYMKAFADLGKLHTVIERVSKLINEFEVVLDTVHERFLFSDLVPERYEEGSEEYAKYLDELKKKFMKKEKEASSQYNLVIQAGIFDFFSSKRSRALEIWEKRYPKRVKALKAATKSMISAAKALETNILKILKTMATDRATRNVDDYVIQANNLVNIFDSFDSKFKSYYNEHIRKFLEKQELFAPTKETEDSKELANEEVDEEKREVPDTLVPSTTQDTLIPPTEPEGFSSNQLGLPFGGEQIGSRSLEVEELAPETQRTPMAPEATPAAVGPTGTIPMSQEEYSLRRQPVSPLTRMPPAPKNPSIQFGTPPAETRRALSPEEQQLRELMQQTKPGPISFEPPKPTIIEHRRGVAKARPASEQFIQSLEALSFESPSVLAKYIRKYAEVIREKEPETYRKLMDIVSSIEV